MRRRTRPSGSYCAALRAARAAADWAPQHWPRASRVVRENLRLAYGHIDPTLWRAIFRHFASAAVDLAWFERLYDDQAHEKHFERTGDAWDDYDPERGAVFVSGHFGNWELFGVAMRQFGIPVAPVARPIAGRGVGARLDGWLDRFRRRHGQDVIDKRNALPLALRALRQNKNVVFLNDQAAGRHGIPAPFFGRPVATFPAPVLLARKADVPVYAGYSTRLGDGIHYRCHAERVHLAGDETAMTAQLNAILERFVRAHPEQWWWFHRRFKARRSERLGHALSDAGVPLA